ncbi:MAG: dihydropteroate synthase [Lentisphaerae bacterium]|nr:dihydropteroate synthase [Lentisphaerota bacterium]
MQVDTFIGVGENIHCTRIYKVGGKFVTQSPDGGWGIAYDADNEARTLRVPSLFTEGGDWGNGKVKHCAVAIWQGNYGEGEDRQAGVDYIQQLAKRQEAAGATYLDINVDEFSTDVAERVKLMQWTVGVTQDAVAIPMSIDSSNEEILEAGLKVCDTSRGRPMVNSVSLERQDAIAVAIKYNAVVIASAAGESGLPANTEERMANLDRLIPMLKAAGLADGDLHIDPLVFPISVDGNNGNGFLEACASVRQQFGAEVHIVAGLSNVSFGMPGRKLINQVFTYLAVEQGADGGIVDPMQINACILSGLDPASESFTLAQDLLTGKDDYGMNFITASREGKL